MTEQVNDSYLWTIVSLENRLFALPVDEVETMVALPPETSSNQTNLFSFCIRKAFFKK